MHTLLRTPRFGDVTEQWATAHNEFHGALVAACDNSWLLRMREMLATQGERYRWLSVTTADKKRDLDKEHSKLSEAVLARDPTLAVKLMKAHLLLTSEILLQAAFVDNGVKRQTLVSTKKGSRLKTVKQPSSRSSSRITADRRS